VLSAKYFLKKPLMVIHSSDDTIIPAIQSRKIYENSPSTKQWLETRGPHVATFGQKKNRETFLQFLENNRS
jgi:predicted alpha/beta-fold hydrolase